MEGSPVGLEMAEDGGVTYGCARAGRMAGQVKEFAVKLDELTSPEPTWCKERTNSYELFSDLQT